ncbi:aldehyde dehydrogenase family protein [Rossellomorea aquimaris]|uniref:aldehyde dehydrogenase family protein n=1 Tax=Rossellomorea aquimaris TaxID=189382 RepID=UPI001CD71554|nr:aldehyde dehydrogenase family protein [Rossellomorea aquimaris]MCA1059437.1 aldehyde dehydrogenase family protein [Rossellomorea aquimaris]
MKREFDKLYINGEWVKGSSENVIPNHSPFDHSVLGSITAASKEDLDKAYKSAEKAQKAWADEPPQAKRQIMERAVSIVEENKELIIEWLINESGSTYMKAAGEVSVSINSMKEAATYPYRMVGKILPSQVPGKENRVYREPLGVVGIISPWNFPFHLAVRSIATALATGNGVVVKPATHTPVTGGLLFASIFEEAGLPKGLLNVVVGKGSEIGDDIVTHPIPRLISFTGSTEVGRRIGELAGRHLKKTALELGGNNVFIVLDDANLDQAVESALFGKFYHQGQICMSINRIMVHKDMYDTFVDAFVSRVKGLNVGNPSDKSTHIGPLIDQDQVDRILKDIESSKDQGAEVVLGGNADKNMLYPTVLTHVTNSMPIAKNEIFGPVAAIIPFNDDEEAIQLANEHPYGLSGAVHSSSIERATNVAHRVETGMIHINDEPVNDEPHMPFGGEKDSGLGRFNGEWALEEFTTVKWLAVQHKRRDYGPFIEKR